MIETTPPLGGPPATLLKYFKTINPANYMPFGQFWSGANPQMLMKNLTIYPARFPISPPKETTSTASKNRSK